MVKDKLVFRHAKGRQMADFRADVTSQAGPLGMNSAVAVHHEYMRQRRWISRLVPTVGGHYVILK